MAKSLILVTLTSIVACPALTSFSGNWRLRICRVLHHFFASERRIRCSRVRLCRIPLRILSITGNRTVRAGKIESLKSAPISQNPDFALVEVNDISKDDLTSVMQGTIYFYLSSSQSNVPPRSRRGHSRRFPSGWPSHPRSHHLCKRPLPLPEVIDGGGAS